MFVHGNNSLNTKHRRYFYDQCGVCLLPLLLLRRNVLRRVVDKRACVWVIVECVKCIKRRTHTQTPAHRHTYTEARHGLPRALSYLSIHFGISYYDSGMSHRGEYIDSVTVQVLTIHNERYTQPHFSFWLALSRSISDSSAPLFRHHHHLCSVFLLSMRIVRITFLSIYVFFILIN